MRMKLNLQLAMLEICSADTNIAVQKDAESAVTFTAKSSGASGQQFNINSSVNTTAVD